MCMVPSRKFDNDQIAGPMPFNSLELSAMNKKATLKRSECGIDALQIGNDIGPKVDL
jgi:hypothetical protein